MDAADIVTLYDYIQWADHKMLNSVDQVSTEDFTREMAGSFGSLRDTLVHIIGAESLWLSRWKGETGTIMDPKTIPAVAQLRHRWQEVESAVSQYVRTLRDEDLPRVFSYRNLKGEPYSVPLGQALQHVANHSTYHRGQVTTLLRQLGHKPETTDLLYFYLERNAKAVAQN